MVAGEVEDTPGPGAGVVDTLLIDRIEQEYRRYFTATGRPTGEWRPPPPGCARPTRTWPSCAAAIAEVDDAVRRHATLTGELHALTAESAARR